MRNSFQWCDKKVDFDLSLNNKEMYIMNREFMLNRYHKKELWIYFVIIIIIDFEIELLIANNWRIENHRDNELISDCIYD